MISPTSGGAHTVDREIVVRAPREAEKISTCLMIEHNGTGFSYRAADCEEIRVYGSQVPSQGRALYSSAALVSPRDSYTETSVLSAGVCACSEQREHFGLLSGSFLWCRISVI